MAFTKQHYEAVADRFAESDARGLSRLERDLLVELADSLADLFEHDNPRFDRDRFLDRALPWTSNGQ
jgi:hypothetical protein